MIILAILMITSYFSGSSVKTKPSREGEHLPAIICDIQECCCQCCCISVQEGYKNYVLAFYEKIKEKATMFLFYRGKEVFFALFSIAPIINLSLQQIFPLFLMNRCVWRQEVVYSICDMVFGSIQILNYIFTITFLGVKLELMSIDSKNIYQRGMILYWCCRKALIFSSFHIILKILIIFVMGISAYELSYAIESLVFWITKCIFLLAFSNFYHARKKIPVEENDNILKTHKRFFSYQGCLLRYLPNENSVYGILAEYTESHREKSADHKLFYRGLIKILNSKVEELCKSADNLLVNELEIIEKQEFRNIQLNDGSNPYIPGGLLIYLIFIDVPLYLISCLLPLMSKHGVDPSLYTSCVLYSLELVIFPWLNFKCLETKVIFGEETDLRIKKIKLLDENDLTNKSNSNKDNTDKSNYSRKSKHSINMSRQGIRIDLSQTKNETS